MPTAELLSQGDEVVTGQITDTNSAWLATRLTEAGVLVARHNTVGDRLQDLVALLRELAGRCDVVISTGGLGPTVDDLTAEAVALAFDRPLALDPEALAEVEGMYARFGRVMPAINRKQALLPQGALRLTNHWGTAPGFAVEVGGTWMAFLPGVPREMRGMFDTWVLPALAERLALSPGELVTLRCAGAGESNLQEALADWSAEGVELGFRAAMPEVYVKLRFSAGYGTERREAVVADVRARLGAAVFAVERPGDPPRPLAAEVGARLSAAGARLAVAESCTGGRLASLCTAIPGASGWFTEGAITYANASKTRLLGVPEALIAEHGAVSEPVARAMAEGMRASSGADFALATTGIAGPDGGSEAKPVGLVHVALATPTQTLHRALRYGGDRERIQLLAATGALDLLRRHLDDAVRSEHAPR